VSSSDPFGLVGQVLDGQFRVDRFIGEGGFSVVYAGLHLGLSEPIALKCMKLPAQLSSALVETFVQRFRDESRLHYKLSQGNLHIARTMAAGTTVSPVTHALVPYMVLEWLDGHSMAAELERSQEKRPLAQVIELFETAVDALTFAQEQGVVHRDLNPGNFFLTNTVAGKRLKVLDFGVAKVLDESRLEVGPRVQTVGKIRIFAPAYGAPEQFDDKLGPIGPYSDVYALALVLLETMAGKTVMAGEHLGDFAMAALDPVSRPSPKSVGLSLPPEVEAVFVRALALRPQDRWPKVKDFWTALRMAARLPNPRSEDDAGNATMLLATMPLGGARASSPRESAADGVDDTTVSGEPGEEAAPATARLGASHLGRPPSSPVFEPPPPNPLATTVALSPAAAATATPSVAKKGDRSQLVTLAMAVRPSLPGAERPAVPMAPPAASLTATMAMPEAPRRPSGNERSHTPPERVSYIPPERRTVALSASPGHPPVASPPVQPHSYITYPEPHAQDRVSEVPGLSPNVSEPNTPPAAAGSTPNVAPAFAADDSAPEPTTSKKGLIGVAMAAGVVVVVLLVVVVVTVVRSRGGDTKPVPSTAPSPAWAIQTGGATDAPSVSTTASVEAPVVSASVAPSVQPSPVPAPPPSTPSTPSTPSPQPPPAPKPTPPPSTPSSPSDPNVFDAALARTKLDHANGVLVVCKTPDGPSGKGSASVVFAPSGQVTSVGLTVPFEGTKPGACVRGQLLRVKTAPFVGAPQSIAYVFTVPK
jgi:serine/threonine protein kinase